MRISTLAAALLLAPALASAASNGYNARLAGQFRRADADGNGTLSRAEAERAAPLLARQFDAIDANHDGQITAEEIRAFRRTGRRVRSGRVGAGGREVATKFDQHFARADANGDGALSRLEAAEGLPRIANKFDRIDRDGDGLLTRAEIQAWFATRRAARTGNAN
jgi:hypothetical protein